MIFVQCFMAIKYLIMSNFVLFVYLSFLYLFTVSLVQNEGKIELFVIFEVWITLNMNCGRSWEQWVPGYFQDSRSSKTKVPAKFLKKAITKISPLRENLLQIYTKEEFWLEFALRRKKLISLSWTEKTFTWVKPEVSSW